MNARPTPSRTARSVLVPATAALLAAGALGGCSATPAGRAAERGTESGGGKAPQATTFATVAAAPRDAARGAGPVTGTDGAVVHPTTPQPVLDRPGGRTVATLPVQQLGGPTWVPVVERSGEWVRVLLPSRPNGASGWIDGRSGGLRNARSPYEVKVDLSDRRLSLIRSGREVDSWRVAVGAPKTPTPTGRTFMLATLEPAKKTPSPLVLPLGAHSATLDSFGGGPGTVAFHGWPDTSVFGKAVSHGCVRVPKEALRELSRVPLGTLVLISG